MKLENRNSINFLMLFLFFLIQLISSFIAWNYIGIFFIINSICILKEVQNIKDNTLYIYSIRIFTSLLAWYLGALFWMFAIEKGLFGFLSNFLIHFVVFILYFLIVKKRNISVFVFIGYWVLFEILYSYISFSFPWLTIGNVLSTHKWIIQYYDITGVFGGSIWLLVISYLIYSLLINRKSRNKVCILLLLVLLLLPVLFYLPYSGMSKNSGLDNHKELHIISVNPEKYERSRIKDRFAFDVLKSIDSSKFRNHYDILLFPETAIRGMHNKKTKHSLVYTYFMKSINNQKFNSISFGTSGFPKEKHLVNSIITLERDTILYKVKKRLVPYSEYMHPSLQQYFKKNFYRSDVEDSDRYIQKKKRNLQLVCYEVLFPFFVANQKENIDYITLHSSEEFMNGNSFAMKQYDNFISLRAVENRIPMIKSSSHGSSFIVETSGSILEKKRNNINYFKLDYTPISSKTVFAQFGLAIDIILCLCIMITSVIFYKIKSSAK